MTTPEGINPEATKASWPGNESYSVVIRNLCDALAASEQRVRELEKEQDRLYMEVNGTNVRLGERLKASEQRVRELENHDGFGESFVKLLTERDALKLKLAASERALERVRRAMRHFRAFGRAQCFTQAQHDILTALEEQYADALASPGSPSS